MSSFGRSWGGDCLERVRAHVFLCMLARYARRHMEKALAPMLLTDQGDPAQSFAALMEDPMTMGKHETRVQGSAVISPQDTDPTPLQEKVFRLLGVSHRR